MLNLRECPRCTTEVVEIDHQEMMIGDLHLSESLWQCPNCGYEMWRDDNGEQSPFAPEDFTGIFDDERR